MTRHHTLRVVPRASRTALLGALLAAALLTTACDPETVSPPPAKPSAVASSPTPSATPTATPTPTATATPEPAPPASTPTRTATPTRTPSPTRTTQAPQPTETQAAGCHPLSNAGNCYKAGQYCRTSDHNVYGTDATGRAIKCVDNNGWRWEPV